MWPWGHAAFGYILYSLTSRAADEGPVTGWHVAVLAVATQLPDLIDKVGAWVFDVFSSGYAAGHSVFLAVPLGAAAIAVAARRDRPTLGVAFAVGYWSHLVGDVLVAVLRGVPYTVERVLWPLVTFPSSESPGGAVDTVLEFFSAFIFLLRTTDDPTVYVLFLGPPLVALAFWLADGAPGLRELYRWVRQPN